MHDYNILYFFEDLRMYCSGHARVKENDQADRLAGKAAITSSLCLGRSEMQMLRCFRHCGYKVKHITSFIAWRREA